MRVHREQRPNGACHGSQLHLRLLATIVQATRQRIRQAQALIARFEQQCAAVRAAVWLVEPRHDRLAEQILEDHRVSCGIVSHAKASCMWESLCRNDAGSSRFLHFQLHRPAAIGRQRLLTVTIYPSGRRARRIVLILDNYRIHKSQMVERWLQGVGRTTAFSWRRSASLPTSGPAGPGGRDCFLRHNTANGERPMTDRYTKTVLTIIAIALCALVAQNSIPRASAQSGCGQWMYNPC